MVIAADRFKFHVEWDDESGVLSAGQMGKAKGLYGFEKCFSITRVLDPSSVAA